MVDGVMFDLRQLVCQEQPNLDILKAEMGEHYRQNYDGAYGENQRADRP